MSAKRSKTLIALAATVTLAAFGTAIAGGPNMGGPGNHQTKGNGHGHGDAMAFGKPGKPSEVSRTIEVVMGDNYFEPEKLVIKDGETVRFVVKNKGEFLHEFNVGTAAMHAAHQKEMMTMMEHGMITASGIDHNKMKMNHGAMGMSGQVHDDPNSVLVEPGKTKKIVWKFAKATDLEFACNVPGHYDAGMVGKIEFRTKRQPGSGS